MVIEFLSSIAVSGLSGLSLNDDTRARGVQQVDNNVAQLQKQKQQTAP